MTVAGFLKSAVSIISGKPGDVPETAADDDDVRVRTLAQVSDDGFHVGAVTARDEVETHHVP